MECGASSCGLQPPTERQTDPPAAGVRNTAVPGLFLLHRFPLIVDDETTRGSFGQPRKYLPKSLQELNPRSYCFLIVLHSGEKVRRAHGSSTGELSGRH